MVTQPRATERIYHVGWDHHTVLPNAGERSRLYHSQIGDTRFIYLGGIEG